MDHSHTMVREPTHFEWKQHKDHVHFYVTLAVIPIAGILRYSSLVIGRPKVELAEIPENYEPEHWEYFPHPMQRFIKSYIHEKPEKTYEVGLHIMNLKNEKRKMNQLEKKMKELMGERQDRPWSFRLIYQSTSNICLPCNGPEKQRKLGKS